MFELNYLEEEIVIILIYYTPAPYEVSYQWDYAASK